MTPEQVIDKIKEKAKQYVHDHATANAKNFYILGKKDAACTFLAMIKSEGLVSSVIDVATEIIKHDPENPHARWILDSEEWKKA